MKRMMTILALVALAACESATAGEPQQQDARVAPGSGPAMVTVPVDSVTGLQHVAVASQTRWLPGIHWLRVTSTSGQVKLEVRCTFSTSGFNSLSTGTVVHSQTGASPREVEMNAPSSSQRCIVIGYPVVGGVPQDAGASFVLVN